MSHEIEHPGKPHSPAAEQLSRCREDIDRIDAVLVALLQERTRLAVCAGRVKAASGQPVTAPAREAAVIERVKHLAQFPLEPDAVVRIFERIIDETRATELRAIEATHVE
jgi:chorismate mutase